MTQQYNNQVDVMDLQKACRLGSLLEIKKAYSADPEKLNKKDESLGWTPLYRTVICNHIKATQFLLKHGADPNLPNNLGETPLHQTADNSQYEIAELLLTYHADPNLQQNDGDTPLHHAAFRGDEKMVELLLRYRADPNIQNFMFGRSPLHYAVDCGHISSVKLLMKYGGNPFLPDRQEKRPIDLAQIKELQNTLNNGEKESESEIMFFDEDKLELGDTFGKGKTLNDSRDIENYEAPTPPIPQNFNFEPDSELSVLPKQNPNKLKPIYSWLESIELQELCDILCDAGYDDIESLIVQMNSAYPITRDELERIGIAAPGHQYRIIMKLEEDACICPKVLSLKSRSIGGESFWRCCNTPNNATMGPPPNINLKEWLRNLKLEELYNQFLESGFDDYEMLIKQMFSRYPINDEMLKTEVGVSKPGYRNRILAKLQEEVKIIEKRDGIVIENTSKNASCEMCIII